MRKFATLAGTALAGGASTASATINLGTSTPSTDAGDGTSAVLGTLGVTNNWCGAPWLWAGQQGGAGCDGAQQHNPTGQ
jgi:hypothetical protein